MRTRAAPGGMSAGGVSAAGTLGEEGTWTREPAGNGNSGDEQTAFHLDT